MGGIVSSIFGGSSEGSKSSSSNQAYSFLKDQLSGQIGQGGQASTAIGDFLGLNGAGGTANAGAGLQNYMNSTGFNSIMDSGQRAITGSNAAKGLFQSGATGKALTQFGQNLGEQTGQNYLGNLQGLAQLGLGAAGTVGGAGGVSTGTSSGSKNDGLLNGIGKVASIASMFSDRRVKTDVVKISEDSDGLGRYSFRYIWSPERIVGVMYDEVAKLRPWAVGPSWFGYGSVDYSKLEAA